MPYNNKFSAVLQPKFYTMYLVREIFHLHFGKYKEAKSLTDEAIAKKLLHQPPGSRILTDFTGEAYRLIFELPYSSLADFEEDLKRELSATDWKNWYEKFKPLVRFSEREILKLINTA
jgi:hypothetical protein